NQRIAVPLLVLPGNQLDAVGGTDLGAQAAGHALGPSLLVGEHAVRAAPPPRERPLLGAALLRVLHGHLGPEQVAQRERHPLEGRPDVRGLLGGALHHLYADRHQASPPCGRAAVPETMRPRSRTQNSGTARAMFRANSARANRASYAQPSAAWRYQIAAASTVRYNRANGSITFHPSAMS